MTDVNPESTNSPSTDTLWATFERHRAMIPVAGSIAIGLLVLCAYWTSMFGDFVWDDDHYVTANPNMRSWEGLKNIWADPGNGTQYYPLTNTVFWVEYQIFGVAHTVGYHLVNMLLHTCGAVLLWILLRRLSVPAAWMIAAVFALHPLQVESVSWISELKNILSGVFYFSSALVYLRYCDLTPAIPIAKTTNEDSLLKREWFALPDDPTRVYALAIFLFACALLSKSVTATMPAAILVVIWWKRGKLVLDDLLPLLPFFALGIGMAVFTSYFEYHTIGASGKPWHFGTSPATEAIARCIIAGRAVWFYLGKLLFPFPLIFSYPQWTIDPKSVAQLLAPISVLAVLIALWVMRKKIGRAPLAGSLFFVGTLFPALGFINIYPMQYSFVADHFQYLACIGIIVLVIGGLAKGVRFLVSQDVLNPAAAPAAGFVLLGALAICTAQHASIFASPDELWRDTIKKTSNLAIGPTATRSWFATNNYGVLLLNRGDYDRAKQWFEKTLRVKPDHAPALYNMGLVAEHEGKPDEAMKFFLQSRAVDSQYDYTNIKLAEIYGKQGRTRESIELYEKLVKAYPENEAFHTDLGVQLTNVGAIDDAINEFNESLRINPDSVLAHLCMGDLMRQLHRDEDAIREYAAVIRLDRKNPYVRISFGLFAVDKHQLTEAAAQFKAAIEYGPKLVDPHFYLARVYLEMQKYPDAIVQFQKVIEMAPDYPKANEGLDVALDLAAHPEHRPATTQSTTRPTTGPTTTSTGKP